MSLYAVVKRAVGIPEDPKPVPAMAQITIISTPVKRSSGSRSPRARV